MDMKYTAIYTKTKTGYSAHIPDLPGCIAAARTLAQTGNSPWVRLLRTYKVCGRTGPEFRAPAPLAAEVEAA